MVGEQINSLQIFHTFVIIQKFSYGVHLFRIVVVSLQQGHADAHVAAVFKQPAQVRQYGLVAHACEGIVLFRIHVLDVEEEEINHFGKLAHHFGAGIAARFHGGVDALVLAGQQQICHGFRLEHGLAAANGNAPAGALVKGPVLFHHFQQFRNPLAFARDGQRPLRAGLDAAPAGDAVKLPVDGMLPLLSCERMNA